MALLANHATTVAVIFGALFLLWLDVVGYVQCVSAVRVKFGMPKALVFSAVLRVNFMPAWPIATESMTLATLDTSEMFVMEPQTSKPTSAKGFLFIPGALVHPHAYAPILGSLANVSGAVCVCIKPRFRHPGIWTADEQHALDVMQKFPRVQTWVISGHSLGAGGFGAARVVSRLLARDSPMGGTRADKARVGGLVMWAGVVTKGAEVDLSKASGLQTLVILASEDSVVPPDGKAEDGSRIRDNLKAFHAPKTKVVVIKGANHGGFGHYGPQRFPRSDKPRTISLEDQQSQVIEHTARFLRGL